MAEFSKTAANIAPGPGAIVSADRVAGGSGSVGDAVYLDSNGAWQQADSDAAETAEARGVVVGVTGIDGATTFVSGEGLAVCVFGPVHGFSGLTPGALGYTSDTAGAFEDAAGTVSWVIGYCFDAQTFFVQPGMALPTS